MAFCLNPFTGNFDTVVIDGFLPYDTVVNDSTVTVPQYRQMHVYGEILILGELVVTGQLIVLDI